MFFLEYSVDRHYKNLVSAYSYQYQSYFSYPVNFSFSFYIIL